MEELEHVGFVWANRTAYRLCPRCFRAVPLQSLERYCINDGNWLLAACPVCDSPINSPYARFCAVCGCAFGQDQTEDTG